MSILSESYEKAKRAVASRPLPLSFKPNLNFSDVSVMSCCGLTESSRAGKASRLQKAAAMTSPSPIRRDISRWITVCEAPTIEKAVPCTPFLTVMFVACAANCANVRFAVPKTASAAVIFATAKVNLVLKSTSSFDYEKTLAGQAPANAV